MELHVKEVRRVPKPTTSMILGFPRIILRNWDFKMTHGSQW